MSHPLKTLPIFFLYLFSSFVFGDTQTLVNSSDNKINFYPWPFRATGWGLGGTRNVDQGDALLPLYGNDAGMLYIDGQAKYANDSNWVTSVGGGIRQIYHDSRILGAYLFFDHNEYKNLNVATSRFLFLSPGIESLGNIWDFRINGYIPVSPQTVNTGIAFADQMEIYNFVQFSGHTQYDQLFNTNANVGPGIDAEIGHNIPLINNFRVYLGGYHFSPKNSSDINGISGRMELPISHFFALTAADSYDNNQHNSVEAGLRLTLGGIRTDQTDKDIQRRMVDPIPRNLATLAHGMGVPVTMATSPDGQAIERTNIYFFTADDGVAFNAALGTNNCTFEHPCSGPSFNQTDINAINGFAPEANFYLNTGSYSLNGLLNLNNGQSIYGRTSNFIAPAYGSQQPILTGALNILGNNTLDSFTLISDDIQTTGITGSNINNVNMNNLNVGTLSANSYTTDIDLTDAGNIIISNSTLNAFDSESSLILSSATNISLTDTNLTLNNNNLNAITANTSINGNSSSIGIFATSSNITMSNNNITAVSNSSAASTSSDIDINSGTLLINGGSLTAISNAASTFAESLGISGISSTGSLTIKISGVQINANATVNNSTSAMATALGIEVANTGRVTDTIVGNSIIDTTANAFGTTTQSQAGAVGIEILDPAGTVVIGNTQFNSFANDNVAAPAPPGTVSALAVGIATASPNTTQFSNSFSVTAQGANATATPCQGIVCN